MRRAVVMFAGMALALSGAQGFALDLVRDGKPVSSIVVADDATKVEQQAAQTLAKYLKMSSGADVPVVKESTNPATTLISVGKTRMAKAAGVTDADLKYDGYHLAVKGGALYLLGRDVPRTEGMPGHVGAQGSWRAALGLLERLGFRWVEPTPMGTHVPALKTVSVPDSLDITFRPPFIYMHPRMCAWGDWSQANNFRTAGLIYSGGGHTWYMAVPDSLYAEHPEFFVMRGGKRLVPQKDNPQYCSTNAEVIRRVGEWTIKKFEEGYDIVALGPADGFLPCECENCAKLSPTDQVHYAQRRIIEACYKKYPDRKVHLLIYGPTSAKPTIFKSYPPNTITELCLTGGLYEEFGDHEKAMDAWRELVPGGATVYVYSMGTYFYGLCPRLTPEAAARELRSWVAHGILGIYWCGGGDNWGAEGPTYYVIGRLASDPSQDTRALLDEYCRLTFGKAGVTMRRYYERLYARVDAERSSRFDWMFRGESVADVFPALLPPGTIEQLGDLLTAAKLEAAGDEKAQGWIRLARLSFDHARLIATVFHHYRSYQLAPTMDKLKQVQAAVQDYRRFAGEVTALGRAEPQFIADFFPYYGIWATPNLGGQGGSLANNFNRLEAPFTWDFDAFVKAGMLPGASRARAVVTRLKTPPTIDGDVDKPVWQDAPWLNMPDLFLAKTEASTKVRIGYDDRCFYAAFDCGEPRMDEMKVVDYPHDGKNFNTECVEIFLAPDGVGRKRMQIVLSPTPEGQRDGRWGYIEDPLHPMALSGEQDLSWNAAGLKRAYRMEKDRRRWTMEVAIPFEDLGVPPPAEGMRWRGNFGRERHLHVWNPQKYADKSEFFLWSPNLQEGGFTVPSAFGDLYFGSMPAAK